MMLVVGVQGVPVFLSFSQSVCHWAQIHYPILACGTGRMMQARRANILNFDDGKDSHNINTKYYLWGKFHLHTIILSVRVTPSAIAPTNTLKQCELQRSSSGYSVLGHTSLPRRHPSKRIIIIRPPPPPPFFGTVVPSSPARSRRARVRRRIATTRRSIIPTMTAAPPPSPEERRRAGDRSRKTRWRRHRSSSDLRCWWRVSSRRRPRTRAGGPLPVALICSLVRRVRTVCLTCQ